MAQNTDFDTRAIIQSFTNISIVELYPGVLPDPRPTSRTGFVALPEERCHTLTHQGTQCRRRSTIHDTIMSEEEKPSLERAEDKLCEQHKNRAPGLAVLIEQRQKKQQWLKEVDNPDNRNKTRHQRNTGSKDTEQNLFQSRRRKESLIPESLVASNKKRLSTSESTTPGQGRAEIIKPSIIRGGKLASESDTFCSTHVHSEKSPLATSMSDALPEDPGQILYPRLRQQAFESDRSFRSRLEDQRNSSSSRSAQQPPSPSSKKARLQRRPTVTESSGSGKYSSVISNYMHLIVDKYDALQQIQGNSDAGYCEMNAKEKKNERKRIRKQQSEIEQLWKQLNMMLQCVDEIVGVETEDDGPTTEAAGWEDVSESKDEF